MCISNERPTVTPYLLDSDLVTGRRCGANGEMNNLRMRGLEKAQHWRLSRCHPREDRETHSYCLTLHWLSKFIPREPCSFQYTVCCCDAEDLWFCSACTCSCHRCAVVGRLSKLCNELLPRHQHFRFQKACVPPLQRHETSAELATSSLTSPQEGSCEPHPLSPSDWCPSRPHRTKLLVVSHLIVSTAFACVQRTAPGSLTISR